MKRNVLIAGLAFVLSETLRQREEEREQRVLGLAQHVGWKDIELMKGCFPLGKEYEGKNTDVFRGISPEGQPSTGVVVQHEDYAFILELDPQVLIYGGN